MNSRVIALCVALALVSFSAAGQSQNQDQGQGQAGQSPSSSSTSDVDNLFNGNPNPSPTPSTPTAPSPGPTSPAAASPPVPAAALRPDDILNDRKLHFFGGLDLYGDVGGGWSQMPDFSQPASNLGRDFGGSMTANLGFEIRPASELRLRGKLSYTFPGASPEALPQLSEMFFDYSVLERVFFRGGIFDYTWGNSQFFLFGNLPARTLPTWVGTSNLPFWERNNLLTTVTTTNYPVSLKMNVPMGFNTLTFLARFDLMNYGFPDPTAPNPKYAGYGVKYDLVTGPIEWTLGGFYQSELTPRSLLSMKTSLFGFDVAAEATMAFPVTFSFSGIGSIPTAGGGIYVGGALQRIYPTAVLGISREWSDANIKMYAEYGYNGERTPGTTWLPDNSGPGGHNTAVGARFGNLGGSGVTLNLLWQQNWSDGSGLIAPFIELSPVGLTTIQVGLPFEWGPNNGEVMNNRLVPGSQRLELLVLVKVSTSFRQ